MSGPVIAERLGAATLAAVRGARLPGYDRTAAAASILHLGVGGFARAHLAVYADDLLAAGVPDVMIHGVSLQSPRAANSLEPQDALYSVLQREGAEASVRIVGSLRSVETGAAAAVARLADPAIRLVSLTVTEHGYGLRAGSHELDEDREDIRHDLAGPGAPVSALGVLVEGLERRRAQGVGPPVVVSLDNLPANGRALRAAVLAVAARRDPALATWIADEVAFPCSVVDRMVPATTPDDRAAVLAATGVLDEAVVVAEPHRSWVIEAAPGLPLLADVGVTLVDDVEPYERRKLWLLNGPHSAAAYGGLLAGHDTIAEAVGDPAVRSLVEALGAEALEVAGLPAALDGEGFRAEVVRRFGNPALRHRCAQVGTDGSQKLPVRILPVVRERSRRGLRSPAAVAVLAAWSLLLEGLDDRLSPDAARRAVLGDLGRDVAAQVEEARAVLTARGVEGWLWIRTS